MDKISFGTLSVMVLFYIGFKYYMDQEYPDRYKRSTTQELETRLSPPEQGANTMTQGMGSKQYSNQLPQSEEIQQVEEKSIRRSLSESELTIENDEIKYVFSQEFAGIESLILKNYKNDEQSAPMELVKSPFIIRAAGSISAFDSYGQFDGLRDGNSISFSFFEGPWKINVSYLIDPKDYGGTVSLSWENTGSKPFNLDSHVVMQETIPFPNKKSGFLPGVPTGKPSFVTGMTGKSGEWQDIQDFCEKGESLSQELQELDFIGFDKHYFLKVLVPDSKKISYKLLSSQLIQGQSCSLSNWMYLQQGFIKPGQSVAMSFKFWFGPKKQNSLKILTQS